MAKNNQVNLGAMMLKLAEVAPEKLYGAELMEDVAELGVVDVDAPGVSLETSKFGGLQIIMEDGGQKAYFSVKREKVLDKKGKVTGWEQPEATSYNLVVRRIRQYGKSTRTWLEENGIDPENFMPGQTVLHAVAQ